MQGMQGQYIYDAAADSTSIADWTTEIDVTDLIRAGDATANFLLTKPNDVSSVSSNTVFFTNNHAGFGSNANKESQYQKAVGKATAAGYDASYLAPALIVEYEDPDDTRTVLERINDAEDIETLKKIVESGRYAEELGIDLTAYRALKDRLAVITELFSHGDFADTEEFRAAFIAAVAAQAAAEQGAIDAFAQYKKDAIADITSYSEDDYDGLAQNTLNTIVKTAISKINASSTDTREAVDTYKNEAITSIDAVLTKSEVQARNSIPQDAWIGSSSYQFNDGFAATLEFRRSGSTDFAGLMKFPLDPTRNVEKATLRVVAERTKDAARNIKISRFDAEWDEANIANGSDTVSGVRSSYAYLKDAIDASRNGNNYVEAVLNGPVLAAIFDAPANGTTIDQWTTEIDVTNLIEEGDKVLNVLITKSNESTDQTVIFSNDHAKYANLERYQTALSKVKEAGYDASYLAPALTVEYEPEYKIAAIEELSSYNKEDYDALGLNTIEAIVKEAKANIRLRSTNTEKKVNLFKEAALRAMDEVLTKAEIEAQGNVQQDAQLSGKIQYNTGFDATLDIRSSGEKDGDFAAVIKVPLNPSRKVKKATLHLVAERTMDREKGIRISDFGGIWDEANIAPGSESLKDVRSSYEFFEEEIHTAKAGAAYVEAVLNSPAVGSVTESDDTSIEDWTTEIDVTELIAAGDDTANFILTKTNESRAPTCIFSKDYANYTDQKRYQTIVEKVKASGHDISYLAPALTVEYEDYDSVIRGSSDSAAQGATAMIDFTVADNTMTGIRGTDLEITYDDAAFTVTEADVTMGTLLKEAIVDVNVGEIGRIGIVSASADDSVIGDGTLVSAVFGVKQDARPGSYPIGLKVKNLYGNDGQEMRKGIRIFDGMITVKDPLEAEKKAAKADIDAIRAKYNDMEYDHAGKMALNNAVSDAKAVIDGAVSIQEIKAAVQAGKEALSSVKTIAEKTADEINRWKISHALVFAKTDETITVADEEEVNAALSEYERLSDAAKVAAVKEKTFLDGLAAKIQELKQIENEAREEAGHWKETYASILEKTVKSVTTADEEAVNAALNAYEGLSGAAKEAVTAEKALLDALAAKITELKSNASSGHGGGGGGIFGSVIPSDDKNGSSSADEPEADSCVKVYRSLATGQKAAIMLPSSEELSVALVSEKPDVLSVGSDGKIQALKAGKSNLTVYVTKKNITTKMVICVTVKDKKNIPGNRILGDVTSTGAGTPVTSVTKTIKGNKTTSFRVTDADGAEVSYHSNNRRIAKVTEDGRITGCKKGSTTVVAAIVKNGVAMKYRVKVTVRK